MFIGITKDGGLSFFVYDVEGEGDHGSVWPGLSVYSMVEESKDGCRCQYWWREENQSACVFYRCRGDDWCKVWRLVVMAATMGMWGVLFY